MKKCKLVLVAVASAAVVFVSGAGGVPVTDHLIVHLDASDTSSLTQVGDVVSEWRSAVGEWALKAGKDVYPDAPFQKSDVTVVTEDGRQGLRFSHHPNPTRDNGDDDAVYAVMSFGDGVRVNAKTFFFVTRQLDSKFHGAIMGGIPSGYGDRLMRNAGVDYAWESENYSRVLINGEETLSFARHGGTAKPFVLTATANGGRSIETVGAAYLLDGGAATASYAVYDKCVIHEILMYDAVLSDEQIRSVSNYLQVKWNLGTTYWTGEGETADWDDAGNWLAGVVPNRTQTAVFYADAAITLTDDLKARRIVNEGASPITLSFENAADVTLDAAIGGAISVEKRGAGTLNVVGGQDYTGETRVLAGTLRAANDNASDVYSKIGGLVTHLDASRADTLVTDANGELLEWKSAAADTTDFVGANVAYPDGRVDGMKEGVTFRHANPYLTTDAVGNPAVRFGCDRTDGTTKIGTFIAKKDKSQIKARTYFFVQTVRKFEICGLLGMIVDANFRMYVSGNSAWDKTGMKESWQNGRKSTGDADRKFEASGSTRPNLLVVRNNAVNAFDVIGGQYLYRTDNQAEVGLGSFLQFDLNEVLMFDTALTDDQIRDISAVLMAKWGVPEQAVTIGESGALSANSDYLVSADATLETGNFVQTARSVSGTGSLKVCTGLKLAEDSSDGTALALDVAGSLDLNGATLPVVSVAGAGTVTDSSEGGVLRVTNDGLLQTAIRLTGGVGLEKFGEGRLELIPGQDNAGATQVKEGTLAMRSAFDYAALGGLVVHLDASKPSTMTTNEKGELVEWRPATAGAKTFVGGGTLTFAPEQTFNHENPTPMAGPGGRAAVLFGRDPANIETVKDTFIKVPNEQITAQTFFIVQTQINSGGAHGLLGMITDYAFRFYRWYAVTYQWSRDNMNESWVNGRKSLVSSDNQSDNPDNTFEASGTAAPNLLVVRNGTAKSFDIFGGQFLETGSHAVNSNCCTPMYVHEVIFFDTALTDDQIRDISATLMDKWNIPRQADVRIENGLSSRSDVEVAAGATFDLGDLGTSIQTLKSAGGSGTLVSHGELSFADVSPYAGSLALAANGLVDLGGGSLSVSNWTGSATVTNSSETTAKLKFTADTDTAADLTVVGNVAFEKGGAGALTLPGGQDYTGTTMLDGGSLAHTGFSRYGHVSFHVDASHAETLTLDADGNVLRWDSLTDDGLYLNNAHDAFPDAKFRTAYAHLVSDANGLPCVRFARDEDNVHTGAVMAASSTISGRTEFFVSRQHNSNCWGGMIGNVFNYNDRVYRNYEQQCLWAVDTASTGAEILVNGKETKSFEDPSGTTGPHVLTVVRTGRAVTHEIIGGDWLQKDNADGEVNPYENMYSQMDLYEVLIFDTLLTDDQIREITVILNQKWQVQVAADIDLGEPSNPFASDSDYVVTAPTGLNLDGFVQAIKSLTFDVSDAGVCPVLAVDGALDVTDTPLAFLNATNVGKGNFLTTTWGLTSPFLSVTGLEGVGKVSYRRKFARISTGGSVILIR